MDATDLQLTDYLQTLQVQVKKRYGDCRVVVIEPGSDTREFDRFIERQFALRQQHYMLTSSARLLETRLATVSRSTHFLLYEHDQLVAVLRVTPAPFEWVALAHEHVSPTVALSRHVEFSRLITRSHNPLSVPINSLLAVATEWAIKRGYQGVTALCRAPQRRLFQRFGLTSITSGALHIEQRARGDYWLLSAQWQQILAAVQHPTPTTVNQPEKHDECARQF